MKKLTTFIITILISFCALTFSGCSNRTPRTIDMSVYFKTSVSSSIYVNDVSSSKSLTIDTLTSSRADSSKMDKYFDFKLTSNAEMIYKMYISKIEFYVLCNESTDSEMTISINITNLASEDNLSSIDTHNDIKEHVPNANIAQKYTFDIDKVVASPTGTSIQIDISESTHLISNRNNPDNNFKWIIYDFKIFGESREYSN